jgi:hypothetical protein
MGLGCINVRSNFIEDYLNKAFDTILVEMVFGGGGRFSSMVIQVTILDRTD